MMRETLAICMEDVRRAAARLHGVAHRTPIYTSRTLDALAGREVYLKCENFQRGGAFKFRGAYNAISQLSPLQRHAGVVTFSSGNHAQGVALAAQLLGVPALICMPDDAPPVKITATRGYGAEVLTYPRLTTDREAFARDVAFERAMTIIPPYDHPDIMAGQGTAALELLDQVPDLDCLVAPVGGGGLLAGCAVAAHGINPKLRIFAVETEGADDLHQSLAQGQRVTIPPPATIADGIRTPTTGQLTFPILKRHVEQALVISDSAVLEALRLLLLRLKLVVEPTGAVGLAAVLAGMLPSDCQRVGVVISGGNLDPSLMAMLWGQG
ncbi:pyridoxal-5'-phosphate-dependent enzyme, beta subunit [Oscillochloris trichoides DG-6]|uniref:Pyridoxal-5'-phosphate-dependent enzyme, beta subunit n=1 Tax=Oscillochloris trichoides DG-6 TaxID=765420 RepID=E1IBV2_9CHLR|nr:pyridoxal-phosphate dependent enzyme [Oscillochloris trichoides]EFO81332.1 pyridoxal-5'-phosphate-dependent enzyme, beta subunit [Oscillochloris trichoides DG-6]